jgi:acetyltransferase-like isoleucine patch superfamily enzyme
VIITRFKDLWARFWMGFAGASPLGRVATWLATWFIPPFYHRIYLARLNLRGYISPRATIYHSDLRLGIHVYIDDSVLIYQDTDGGSVELGNGVHLNRDTIIQTGLGGSLTVGAHTHIQPRCQFSAYKASIQIGCRVDITPNCAFYPYNHGFAADKPIREQSLQTQGGIFVGDDTWLGVNVIVLDGVRIGKGSWVYPDYGILGLP